MSSQKLIIGGALGAGAIGGVVCITQPKTMKKNSQR